MKRLKRNISGITIYWRGIKKTYRNKLWLFRMLRPLIRSVPLITSLIDERAATHDRINPDERSFVQYFPIVKSEGFDRLPPPQMHTTIISSYYTYNPLSCVCEIRRVRTHISHATSVKWNFTGPLAPSVIYRGTPRTAPTVAPAREQNATNRCGRRAVCCN